VPGVETRAAGFTGNKTPNLRNAHIVSSEKKEICGFDLQGTVKKLQHFR